MATQADIKNNNWTLDLNNAGKVVQGLDAIKQRIYVVLYTVPGSDPLRPFFGCDIFSRLDQPINTAIPAMINDINDALVAWVPEITMQKISSNTDSTGKPAFSIKFKINNTVTTSQADVIYGL